MKNTVLLGDLRDALSLISPNATVDLFVNGHPWMAFEPHAEDGRIVLRPVGPIAGWDVLVCDLLDWLDNELCVLPAATPVFVGDDEDEFALCSELLNSPGDVLLRPDLAQGALTVFERVGVLLRACE